MVLPDNLVSLAKLARELDVHLATCHRWRQRGVRGVKLACVRVGGRWFATEDAAAAFLAALNGGKDMTPADDVREDAIEAVLTSRGL